MYFNTPPPPSLLVIVNTYCYHEVSEDLYFFNVSINCVHSLCTFNCDLEQIDSVEKIPQDITTFATTSSLH